MTTKLDKKTLKGIRLDGQIIPSTTDNVQVQARYVQVTPDPTDLNNILGMSNVTGSTSGGCANNLYDVLTGMIPYTGATKNVNLGSHTITSLGFGLTNPKAVPSDSIDDYGYGTQLLINGSSTTNCMGLRSIYTDVIMDWSFNDLTLKDAIDFLYSNCVPYTGARTNVNLGSHTITSLGFGLTNPKAIPSDSIDDYGYGTQLLINGSSTTNCMELRSIYTDVIMDWSFNDLTLKDAIDYIHDKVNHITQPLRFKGVINTGGKLPTSGMEIGDVYHFNADVGPYNIGDEVVYVGNTPGVDGPWELLGQNITPIPDSKITFAELEKP